MSKVAQYLQQHVVGEVITSPDAREYFSTDASIFNIEPQIVVYPRTENDVRKIARFSWQLAERGRLVPITARGSGTDLSGAALGQGVIVVFPAHMNKILTLDSNKSFATVQPGINYGKLQQTLLTHGQFLPPYPSSAEYSTVGGAVANNASGEKSVKYGATSDYAKELRVVLANGEVINTKRLSKKELSHKKGLPTFEGELYRSLDNLLSDNAEIIQNSLFGQKNVSGYNIWDVKGNDGSFDLTPLFVGGQGTLGVISEIRIDTEPYNPQPTLVVAYIDDIEKINDTLIKIRKLEPSVIEMVDRNLLEFIDSFNPNQIKGVIDSPFPQMVLLVEFDDSATHKRKKRSKKARKIFEEIGAKTFVIQDKHQQEDYWKIRHSAAAVLWQNSGNKRALPIIDDGVVPLNVFGEYLGKVQELFAKYHLDPPPVWGHAGSGNLHMQPYFDISILGDRQRIFRLMDDYYDIVISLGGSISGEHNDGRLRAPYVQKMYGDEVYSIFKKVKQIFDPYGILNPGVKIDGNQKDLQHYIRNNYSLSHLYDHMPRT